MSKVYNPTLQERLEEYLRTSGISQAKLAPKVGISQTALSQYRRSKYDNGDIAELERKLEEFFRTEEAVEAAAVKAAPYRPTVDYIPTSISEDVYKAIQYCQIERGMVILHGDAGIGKTKGAERFIRENPTAAVYIQATPSSGTLGNILKLLARALRVPETRNKLELQLAIREKLEGTNRVIIIDEAQHLKLNALEEIRTLSDPNSLTGQRGTGICLIGNTEVYSRMVGKQEAQFAQLFSRIRMNRYARYKVGGTYDSVGVERFEFPDGQPGTLKVWLVFSQPAAKSFVVSEVQLLDTSEEVFLSQPEAIQVDANQEGCLYEVTFKFEEG